MNLLKQSVAWLEIAKHSRDIAHQCQSTSQDLLAKLVHWSLSWQLRLVQSQSINEVPHSMCMDVQQLRVCSCASVTKQRVSLAA